MTDNNTEPVLCTCAQHPCQHDPVEPDESGNAGPYGGTNPKPQRIEKDDDES